MNHPAARLGPLAALAIAIAIPLAACGGDDEARTTTTPSTTASTTAPDATGPVEAVDAAVLAVDPDSGSVQVRRPEGRRPETLALDDDAEVTVQGPDGPLDLALADLKDFVDRRRADLGGTQDGVPFSLEITGRGGDRRVTALREIPPG